MSATPTAASLVARIEWEGRAAAAAAAATAKATAEHSQFLR